MVTDPFSEKTNMVIVDGCVRTRLDLRCYRLAAVQKAAYRLADRCTVMLGEIEDYRIQVRVLLKPGTLDPDGREIMRMFFQELMDQELRERVSEETAPLRALLIAQAFSKTNLIRGE